jgi:type I restriction enzyme R subunit
MAQDAARAEAAVHADPRTACFYARRTLELIVDWLYLNDMDFAKPWETQLASLLAAPSFQKNVPSAIVAKARVIKDLGNSAVHGKGLIRPSDAVVAVRELFHVAYWFGRTYSENWRHEGVQFDVARLPPAPNVEALAATNAEAAKKERETTEALQKLQADLRAKDEELACEREAKIAASATLEAQIAALQVEIAEFKKKAALVPDTHDYSEAQTRDYFIDLMLRESGWGAKGWKQGEDVEYPVKGMAKGSGKTGDGYVDYVLWGEDGKPLGLVEAKRTKKDARIGQQQATLYADCLEKEFGRRPIIYYSNGYETWIWDDFFYPPRPVSGFHTKDQLELLIARRETRRDPQKETINRAIVERPYQIEAIREYGKRISGGHRKGLLVMATGSGKTRVAIALVDVLMRAGWAKRVLFLADRTSLVDQACGQFKKHLKDSSPVNLLTDKTSTGRVYLSTYPTMLNLIESMRSGEDGVERRFGPGHFDLVIIDEAHRSVYQKYRAIFEYFDSLLLGLTATPRDEVDRDTYGLFDLQQGLPTFAYELEDAVKDGYLVPYKAISVPLKFQREGIKYNELSEDDKARWDAIEWDEDGAPPPTEVDPEAVNKWLFNTDTVDKVLAHLMEKGIKVAGGDRLGKTIIFAKNKEHARFIEQRFNVHYPSQKGVFARVIDHYEPYAAVLLDDFKIATKPPHIAVSVDMLDTGIDVPEVVNLVFFKLVRSRTKFWQMIGRGTRLCEDLFGPGQDKQCFYIFDFCQNLEYFSQNPAGVEGQAQMSLRATIFAKRLDLHLGTSQMAEKDDAVRFMRGETADLLHAEVAAMNIENFLVRPVRRSVEAFRERGRWDTLTPEDYAQAQHDLAGLPAELEPEDETAKRFDLLILRVQLAILNHEARFKGFRAQVMEIAAALSEKQDIPMVAAEMALILDLQTDEWWQNTTLPMLDQARKKLRGLVKFVDRARGNIVFTDFEDEIGEGQDVNIGELSSVVDIAQYRAKVLAFLKAHENHIAVRKVRMSEPLTRTDLTELERLLFESSGLGGRADFERAFGPQNSLGIFIRSLVGLDRTAAQGAFAEFLDGSKYTADQIRFVGLIVEHLTRNGVMDPAMLYESPYTDVSPSGLDGVFDDGAAHRIVDVLSRIERNATITTTGMS